MKKIAGITAVFIFVITLFSGNSFAADKRTDKLYEHYNSTSTPPESIKQSMLRSRVGRLEKLRGESGLSGQKRVITSPPAVKPAGVSGMGTLAADSQFKLGEVYCYPNPAKKTNPTFHIETGLADKVELKVYDVAGDTIHETVLTGMPQVINDGQGPQYAYEYLWDIKNTGSGVYVFSITAKKGDKTLKKTGRCAVIK